MGLLWRGVLYPDGRLHSERVCIKRGVHTGVSIQGGLHPGGFCIQGGSASTGVCIHGDLHPGRGSADKGLHPGRSASGGVYI